MRVENQTAFCRNVNLRKESHGEDKVAAVTIAITGIKMDAELLDELCPMSQQKLSDVLFVDANPRLQQLYPLSLDLELEPYTVQINRLRMQHCTIKGITLTPEVGRSVSVSLKVHTLMEDSFAAPLARAQQEDVRISIEPAQVDVEDQQAKAA